MIKEIFPWGKRGYRISFANTKETALLTAEKARKLNKILALPGSKV